jgi:hypothetical protein
MEEWTKNTFERRPGNERIELRRIRGMKYS